MSPSLRVIRIKFPFKFQTRAPWSYSMASTWKKPPQLLLLSAAPFNSTIMISTTEIQPPPPPPPLPPQAPVGCFFNDANSSVIYSQPNQTLNLSLVVNSTSVLVGEHVALIRIITNDTLAGYCFSDFSVISIKLNVVTRVDTYVYVDWNSPEAISFTIINVLMILMCLIFIGLLIVYRFPLRSSSFTFSTLMVVGSLMVLVSVFFWIGEPSTASCNLRIWLAGIGQSMILACLTAKNYRIWRIYDRSDHGLQTSLPDSTLLLFVVLILSRTLR
eukprot:TRINITY_DN1673_c0_g8_i1.p1 TRINITY_DN1673_c0_g8~~TRINITY_DN1673_c0_g8_i1.p1  ORF type:complete len:273 (-),score=43.68 TRINITY_DN1673_c0_g8_i1:4-822(-)